MKSIKDNIKKLLYETPELRDDRQGFIYEYYHEFHMNMMLKDAGLFLFHLTLKKLPSIATLERLWRMVQMESPELRGSEWNKRQRQVKPVKKDLGYNIKK